MGITGTDRISELPESITHHILSFLPIKRAASTTILSKRWNNLWLSLPVLDFTEWRSPPTATTALEDRNEEEEDEEADSDTDGSEQEYRVIKDSPPVDLSETDRFMQFLDKVLFLDNLAHIKKFCLKTDSKYFDQDRVKKWIISIVMHAVEELILSIKCSGSRVVPLELFNCESLTVLDLQFENKQDERLAVQVFCNCPVLEDLHMSKILDDSSVLPRSFHMFRNLVSFEVDIMYYGQIKSLFDTILQFSPNLTSLVFLQLFAYVKVGEDALSLNVVPRCLLLCLKFIEFRNFYGHPGEIEVVKLFLENARVLQLITLGSSSHRLEYMNKKKPTAEEVEDANHKILEQLLPFSWASPDCMVTFSGP
ncbi:hypothetical protein C5167_031055 [Papaver somniferum]|nr:hypothetical protein C5167_031055 [Papaver somniferum]